VSGQGNYAGGWRRFWQVTLAVSLVPSALVVRPAVLLGTAATGALIAAVVSLVISSDRDEPVAVRLGRLRQATGWGAAVMAMTVFLGTLSGSLMLLTLFLALLSSPPLVIGTRDWVARVTRLAPDPADQLPLERTNRDALARLTSAELCQAWCSTHRRLRTGPPADEVAACARLRQMVLEELERRYPREVAKWLSTGGSAQEAPDRFLPLDPRNG
jgi:hypothetical protein